MKFPFNLSLIAVVAAFVLVSVSGCERRPQPYAGIPSDKAKEHFDPQSNNK